MAEQCPPNREWIDWATDRWLDLDPKSPEASALLNEIFRENARLRLRRAPRRLRRRDVLQRRDPETLRTMIWLRTRKMLRARGIGLRSVPAGRQVAWPFGGSEGEADVIARKDSYGDDLPSWAAKVRASDVPWLRTQADLHAVAHWLSPEARAALQEPSASSLPDYVNHKWRDAIAGRPQADLFGADGVAVTDGKAFSPNHRRLDGSGEGE
jgi:hypothetical protein